MKTQYDVIIVGAGPAGLAAAVAAAKSKCSVAILDNNPFAGGQIWRAGPVFKTPQVAQSYYDQIQNTPNIDLIQSAKIVAVPQKGKLLVELLNDSQIFHYQTLILCTGAREIFLPFPGWTLSGVTGAGGLQALIKSGVPVTQERVVVAGSGPLLLATADTVRKAKGEILYIAEQATRSQVFDFAWQLWRWPAKLMQAMTLPHHLYHANSYVIEAFGGNRLEGVRLQTPKGIIDIECERLAYGFGLTPNTQLAQLLGCQIVEQAVSVNSTGQTSQDYIFAAGECTGVGGNELAQIEGAIAGYAATSQDAAAQALMRQKNRYQIFANLLKQCFQLRPEIKKLAKANTILCRCEDVTYGEVVNRKNWIDAKLHTRCGMGACQGSSCALAVSYLFDWDIPASRPPLFPTRASSLLSLKDNSLN